MNAPVVSTIVLGLAWFAAINLAASALAWCAALVAVRSSELRRGSVLLAIRLFPAAASTVFAAALFAPAHWILEPSETRESYGVLVWALSALGAVILLRSGARVLAVARAGWRLRSCRAVGDAGIYEVPGLAGVSLAGVFRTRILVGSAVREALSADELEVAVAHECAHRASLDNLKRSVMFCAPDVFGTAALAREIEAKWRATAEWLADARAVGGDQVRAMRLASALVKVSRLVSPAVSFVTSPAWSTLHDPPLLELRVRRLVGTAPAAGMPHRGVAITVGVAAVGAMLSSAVAAYPTVHGLTELLIRVLP
ncbi:MAG TPA: hypothetical protein VF147_07960 [Vicinamibacterales bacterium]